MPALRYHAKTCVFDPNSTRFSTTCVFCSESFQTNEDIIQHLRVAHEGLGNPRFRQGKPVNCASQSSIPKESTSAHPALPTHTNKPVVYPNWLLSLPSFKFVDDALACLPGFADQPMVVQFQKDSSSYTLSPYQCVKVSNGFMMNCGKGVVCCDWLVNPLLSSCAGKKLDITGEELDDGMSDEQNERTSRKRNSQDPMSMEKKYKGEEDPTSHPLSDATSDAFPLLNQSINEFLRDLNIRPSNEPLRHPFSHSFDHSPMNHNPTYSFIAIGTLASEGAHGLTWAHDECERSLDNDQIILDTEPMNDGDECKLNADGKHKNGCLIIGRVCSETQEFNIEYILSLTSGHAVYVKWLPSMNKSGSVNDLMGKMEKQSIIGHVLCLNANGTVCIYTIPTLEYMTSEPRSNAHCPPTFTLIPAVTFTAGSVRFTAVDCVCVNGRMNVVCSGIDEAVYAFELCDIKDRAADKYSLVSVTSRTSMRLSHDLITQLTYIQSSNVFFITSKSKGHGEVLDLSTGEFSPFSSSGNMINHIRVFDSKTKRQLIVVSESSIYLLSRIGAKLQRVCDIEEGIVSAFMDESESYIVLLTKYGTVCVCPVNAMVTAKKNKSTKVIHTLHDSCMSVDSLMGDHVHGREMNEGECVKRIMLSDSSVQSNSHMSYSNLWSSCCSYAPSHDFPPQSSRKNNTMSQPSYLGVGLGGYNGLFVLRFFEGFSSMNM